MKSSLFCALVAASFLTAAAHADTVNLTLQPTTVTPGATASFTATLSAPSTNGAPVYLNGDSFTFNGPQDIAIDDSYLIANFDALLTPGQSETGILFTATVPSTEALGIYTGSYILQGGADENTYNLLSTQPFTLNVANSTPSSVTPEPSSYLLVCTGLLGGLALAARRRFVMESKCSPLEN